jgi:high affinity Mn2+ porin
VNLLAHVKTRAIARACTVTAVLPFFAAVSPSALSAQEEADPDRPDWYSFHIQGTYTTQGHPAFHSAIPDGQQSMLSRSQMAETGDITLYAGLRLGGLEIYFNPEMDQGFGPSSTYGVAGYTSGEAYKAGQFSPYYRTARLFGRYVFNLGGETQSIADGLNQIRGPRQADNITVTAGKFGIADIFDTNAYAHDPRNDFFNWAVIESGAFDYGAELWGYTYGGAVEWTQDWWTLRAGFFDMSRLPNKADLTVNFQNSQTIMEAEERHDWMGRPGKIKILGFLMNARMGAYAEAVRLGAATGQTPDTALVRQFHLRPGGGINIEQELADGIGAFLKASMNDGRYEEYDFTEINQSLAAGIAIRGDRWGRPEDTVGLAGAVNGISSEAQRYFAAGGMGGLIGDGALPSYGAEKILEAYYRFGLTPGVHLSADYQHVINPAYDTVRGPVEMWAFRIHAEY